MLPLTPGLHRFDFLDEVAEPQRQIGQLPPLLGILQTERHREVPLAVGEVMDLSGRDRSLHLGIGHLGFKPQLLDLCANVARLLIELLNVLFVPQAVAYLSDTTRAVFDHRRATKAQPTRLGNLDVIGVCL